MTGIDFSKWLNNEFIPNNDEYLWIKDVSSKSVKQSIINADKAYKKFFRQQSKFPGFKKKNKSNVSMYFVKTDHKSIIKFERHSIKIPTIGWVRLKEKGYIPRDRIIRSGTVSKKADRYFVSVVVEIKDCKKEKLNDLGIGIDLGIKYFAIISDGKVFRNINKSGKVKKLEKQLKREQRCLSRKYESYQQRKRKNIKEIATKQNIYKQELKVQKLHLRLFNIRNDYLNQVVNEVVKTKSSYITIEDLNVSGMMKNRHLSKAIQKQKFYDFKKKLKIKCNESGIELRIVDRFYPSSKTCNHCGFVNNNLQLSDREFVCKCGYKADRDFNASLNLRNAKTYKIA
jgi:putative transposase